MLPALPTGMQSRSGASPRSSAISKAAVFWPWMRYGLTEFISATGYCAASSRTTRSASSNEPSSATMSAP